MTLVLCDDDAAQVGHRQIVAIELLSEANDRQMSAKQIALGCSFVCDGL